MSKVNSKVECSEDSIPHTANVRLCSARLILQTLNLIHKNNVGWNDVEWKSLDLVQGPGDTASAEWIRIQSHHHPWEDMFKAQIGCQEERYCNVELRGADGSVLCHHVFLLNVSDLLDDILLDRIESNKPPTSTNVLLIVLEGVRVKEIRAVLSLLYTGTTKVNEDDEKRFYEAIWMLQIKKVRLERSPPGFDQLVLRRNMEMPISPSCPTTSTGNVLNQDADKFFSPVQIRRPKVGNNENVHTSKIASVKELNITPSIRLNTYDVEIDDAETNASQAVGNYKSNNPYLLEREDQVTIFGVEKNDSVVEHENEENVKTKGNKLYVSGKGINVARSQVEEEHDEQEDYHETGASKIGKYEKDNTYIPIHENDATSSEEDDVDDEDETYSSSHYSESNIKLVSNRITRSLTKAKCFNTSRKYVCSNVTRYFLRKMDKRSTSSNNASSHMKSVNKKHLETRNYSSGNSEQKRIALPKIKKEYSNKEESEEEERGAEIRDPSYRVEICANTIDDEESSSASLSSRSLEEYGSNGELDVAEICGDRRICTANVFSLKTRSPHDETFSDKGFAKCNDESQNVCYSCQSVFDKYSIIEFANHVETCSNVNQRNCKRYIHYDDAEGTDAKSFMETQEGSDFSGLHGDAVHLNEYQVQIDDLSDDAIAQLMKLVKSGKPVHISRPRGLKYCFSERHSIMASRAPEEMNITGEHKKFTSNAGSNSGGAQKRKMEILARSITSSNGQEPTSKKLATEALGKPDVKTKEQVKPSHVLVLNNVDELG